MQLGEVRPAADGGGHFPTPDFRHVEEQQICKFGNLNHDRLLRFGREKLRLYYFQV
jgi:hypothetical protein